MALGIWDTSVAQALADEVSDRRLASIQYEQDHGMKLKDKDAVEHKLSQQARFVADLIAKDIYTRVMSKPCGRAALAAHLANHALCSCCLNLQPQLACCLNKCGRRLCTNCITDLGICNNIGVCRQRLQLTAWRAGVKVINKDDELYKQWKQATDDADKNIERTQCGRVSDGHQAEAANRHNNLIGHVIARWAPRLSSAASVQPPGHLATESHSRTPEAGSRD